MKASVYHLQLNVRDASASVPFYRDLLGYFEYRVLMETRDFLGMSNGTTDFWIIETPKERAAIPFHRKNTGLNHLAFRVPTRDAVDTFAREFLVTRGIPSLYGPAREYPEYTLGYYGVFFEDPDRLKLEVVYVP